MIELDINYLIDVFFLIAFTGINLLSFILRKKSFRYLNEEFRKNNDIINWAMADNSKYENRKGILLKRIAYFVNIFGNVLIIVAYFLIK